MYRLLPIVLLTLSACTDMVLPDTQVTIGDGVEFGIDPFAPHPALGVTVTDPLHQMR